MLKAIRNIDYVVLLCEDIDRMKWFYHEILGFPIYRDWPGWVEMRVGASLLTLPGVGVSLNRSHFPPKQREGVQGDPCRGVGCPH